MLKITNDNFVSKVLEAASPVYVYFCSPTCGPCKLVKPIMEQLETAGHVVAKCDVTESEISADYGISAVPTVILFKNGGVVKKWVGVKKMEDYIS